MTEQNTASLLWLGAGDIAERCLPRLAEQNMECALVSRSMASRSMASRSMNSRSAPSRSRPQPAIERTTVKRLDANLSSPEQALSLAQIRPDFCVCTFSPKNRSESAYHDAYLNSLGNILDAFAEIKHAPRLVIFVSSTSVYGQRDAEQVNEKSETSPDSVSSSTMLACEARLAEQPFATCALRFSGIYGPGRYHLLKQAAKGAIGADHYTNRIHADDCAAIIAFLINRSLNAEHIPSTLLASDSLPVVSKALYEWLSKYMQSEGISLEANDGEATKGRPKGSTNRGLGKRCDNQLLRSLGYRFRYSDYRDGFPEIIRAFQESGSGRG